MEYFANSLNLQPALVTSLLANPATDINDGIYFGFGGASSGVGNVVAPPGAPLPGALVFDQVQPPTLVPEPDYNLGLVVLGAVAGSVTLLRAKRGKVA